MKEKNKNKNDETVETVTHTHTHTHTEYLVKLNKKIIIVAIIIIAIILISMILLRRNNTNKIDVEEYAEKEQEIVNLNVEIKEETDEKYKCLLTFISKDENNKIKSIEYPKEDGKDIQVITVANEEGKEKIGIDYTFLKDDINKIFKITMNDKSVIEKRTAYTIKYDENTGINSPKDEMTILGKNTILASEQPIKEGYVFWGWSEDKSATEPSYLKKDEFVNSDNKEDINLYAVWESQDKGIIRYIASSTVNETGIYSTTTLGIKYNFEVIYLTPSNIAGYGGSYNTSTNTYIINDLILGTAEGIEIDQEATQAMTVLKCDGNLTINGTVTTSTYSQTSPSGIIGDVTRIKGLFIYCSGTLTNNGTITQTARGTYETVGEDVYLWSKNSSYENYTVPKIGALGGVSVGGGPITINGNKGIDGINRQSGGGGSGGAYSSATKGKAYSGNGSAGTAYSGGAGGGGAAAREHNPRTGGSGSALCLGGNGGAASARPARWRSRNNWRSR